ncbi:hypothetical protein GLOTRDRAFT_127937 [Gloeophyllum trabeum ATCC 11539]|uniref:Uncharacterized protein n=1 Tax=Gloeophyllum trabeum (strain ATCC 11539 / FP-39264 / Madison 617) TaxID=670483 RepID=S7RWA5_GLOTA|nr:uncharacterized protein GLOTRDRAFT_127937 [Gloeophyllum trabeum ATCC 11539]EPQ57584.1 hypothetical protein GLOTRDRAFT_127937 [Gloeophyllum trabeum ATCC 11539]
MQLPAICVLAATVLATNAAITFDPFSPNIFSIIPSQAEPPQCFWSGTSPFCAGSCPEGYTDTATSSCGDGACCWTGYKNVVMRIKLVLR